MGQFNFLGHDKKCRSTLPLKVFVTKAKVPFPSMYYYYLFIYWGGSNVIIILIMLSTNVDQELW